MITINLGNEKVMVEEYIPIEIFQQIQKNPLKYNNSDELLALYLKKDIEQIREYPMEQIEFVEGYLTSILQEAPQEIKLESIIEYDGVRYGLENEWNKIKWGMWVDMEVFSQADKINDHIHLLMGILYRPIVSENKKGYKIEPYNSNTLNDRAEIMKKLDTKYWFGAASFFLETSHQYIKGMQRSLKWKMTMWKIMNKLNTLMMKLPSFLRPKRLQDFISNSPIPLQEKILRSSNR